MKPLNYFMLGFIVSYSMTGVLTYRFVEKLSDSRTAIRYAVSWPTAIMAATDNIVDKRKK